MQHRIRTTIAATAGLALLGTGFATTVQAATPYACSGVSGCTVVSTADVDGDGARDSVGLKVWGSAAEGQQLTTRVTTADGEVMQTVTQTSRSMDEAADLFRGSAKIDGEDGYEVVVMSDLGAHTAYYRVITYRDGRLTTLKDPRNRYRWITDGSVWSGYSYQRTTSSTGALKMVTREAVDGDRDGDFTQKTFSNTWKQGSWARMSSSTRYNVSATTAKRYYGWVVPYLSPGI